MKKSFGVVLFCMTGLLPNCSSFKMVDFREIKQHIAAVAPAWNEEPIIVLSDSSSWELVVKPEGNLMNCRECVVYYVNKQIPDVLETMIVRYNETMEQPPRVTIRICYPTGSTWSAASSPSQWDRVPAPHGFMSNQLFWEKKLPKYKQGMVVTQIVERTIIRPEFYSMEIVRKTMPVKDRWMRLIIPAGALIRQKLLNNEGLSINGRTDTVAGKTVITHTAQNLEKIDEQDHCLEPEQCIASWYFSVPPRGTVSYSWKQLGDYYLDLITQAYSGEDRLQGFMPEIESASADTIMNRILLLVRRQIRYHSNAGGIYAIVPHALSSTVKNGYGDCKEMSILCQALARRNRLPADLVLTNATEEFQACDSVPTLGAFNHVVLGYTRPNGERLLVDPTRSYGKPLETGFYFQGKKALFLQKNRSYFDTVPTPTTFYNTITTRSSVSFNEAVKSWELQGMVSLCGLTAMTLFDDMEALGSQAQINVFKEYLKRFFELDATGISIKRVVPDTLTVGFNSFFQENYLSISNGGFMINKPSLFGGDIRFTTLSYSGPRYFAAMEQNDTWTVPKKFATLEKEHLATDIAKGSWALRDNVVSRQFIQKRVRVEKEKAGEFVRLKTAFSKAMIWKSK